jgi:hypothetical protein
MNGHNRIVQLLLHYQLNTRLSRLSESTAERYRRGGEGSRAIGWVGVPQWAKLLA